MKVVGLISGGKDSIYNLYKCVEAGHQIVAVGNLYNPLQGEEGTEMDSYMYQTVGTNVTPAIAEALGVPIYRRPIQGKPKLMTLTYEGTEGDEVEDLDTLLRDVVAAHPDVQGVSSGAIFSTYQKLRVEDVCKRFGLVSLAYLWEREQAQLLREMIECPIDAVVIKVASYGLRAQHLGHTLQELEPVFLKLREECGMNMCGEGGEYESLVLDCPLYKKRLVLEQTEVVEVDKSELAPVAYLRIKNIVLVPK